MYEKLHKTLQHDLRVASILSKLYRLYENEYRIQIKSKTELECHQYQKKE